MSSFLYDTNVLIQIVPNLKTAQQFLLDKFFTNQVTSDTEKVSIDIDVGKRRMAPFVSLAATINPSPSASTAWRWCPRAKDHHQELDQVREEAWKKNQQHAKEPVLGHMRVW